MKQDFTKEAILNKARLDKFVLILTLPKCMQDIITTSQRVKTLVNQNTLQFSIYSVPVPTISVPHIDLPFGGQVAKISSMARPTWPPLVVNFTIDNTFTNYWVLWKWADIINNSKEGVYESSAGAIDPLLAPKRIIGTLVDYTANITVYGKDEFNHNVIQFDYTGCFITELAPIAYNYRSPDEITSSFTMQYTSFEATLV